MSHINGEKVDLTDLLGDLEKAVSSDDSIAAIKYAEMALMGELDMGLLLNIAAVVFSEQGAMLFEKELKKDLIYKGLKLLLSSEDPCASDAVTLASYACNPFNGIEREILDTGLMMKGDFGVEDKDCAYEVIRQFLVVALEKDTFIHYDFGELTEFTARELNDPELAETIVRKGMEMISQKGIDSSFDISNFVKYVINPENGLNKPELGRELFLKGIEAIQKRGGYSRWNYLPMAELAGRKNDGLGDIPLAREVVLAGLQALNSAPDNDENERDFTRLARFVLETFDDRKWSEEIVLEGVEYLVKKGGWAGSFIGLAEFAINSNTLDDPGLGKEIVKSGLKAVLLCDNDASNIIPLAEFAVKKNKYKGLNDIELGREIVETAVGKAVKDSWSVWEFVQLAQFSRKCGGLDDTKLARKIVLQCLEILNSNENPSEYDYEQLAEFVLSSTDGLGDSALASDILIKTKKNEC